MKALLEGRTIPAGALRHCRQTQRDRKDLGMERWREASQSGDMGVGEVGEGAQDWGPAELQRHRVEESTVDWLEESLQCQLKWRNTTQQRAGN